MANDVPPRLFLRGNDRASRNFCIVRTGLPVRERGVRGTSARKRRSRVRRPRNVISRRPKPPAFGPDYTEGSLRGVVSRVERVRSAAARHSINQSCRCRCCCCCCASHVGGKRGRSNSVTWSVNRDRPVKIYSRIRLYTRIREGPRCEFLAKVECKTWMKEKARRNQPR